MFSFASQRRRRSFASPHSACTSPIDRLERRSLLAGNVTVSVTLDPFTTTIVGDDADNSIRIVVENGQVVVRGIGTTINGSTAAFPLTFGGQVTPNPPTPITFNLNGGNDSIEILDIGSMWDFVIAGSAGNDTTVIRDSDTLGMINYGEGATDSGNDRLTIINSIIGQGIRVDTGAGNDIVTLQGVESGDLTTLTLGIGDDTLTLNEFVAFPYHPPMATVQIEAGDGNDRLQLSNCEYAQYGELTYTVDLGNGNDFLEMTRVDIPVLNVRGGMGNDTTILRSDASVLWSREFHYGAGDGNDSLLIAGVATDVVLVDMGAGNDTLDIQDTTIRRDALIVGSTGLDLTRLRNVTALVFRYGMEGNDLGNDLLSISLSRLGPTSLNLGGGNDRLVIDRSQISTSQILLGDGNDRLESTAWTGGSIDLDAGRGSDLITTEIDAAQISLLGGEGNDLFEMRNLRIRQASSIDAGAGNDVVAILSGGVESVLNLNGGTGRDTLFVSLQFQLIGSISVSSFENRIQSWSLLA